MLQNCSQDVAIYTLPLLYTRAIVCLFKSHPAMTTTDLTIGISLQVQVLMRVCEVALRQ